MIKVCICQKLFAGSPAEAAGLQRDDYIRAVDGVPASTTSIDEVRNKIVGVAGTKVKVTVLRGDKEITFELTRKAVNVPKCTAAALRMVLVICKSRTFPAMRMRILTNS